MKYLEYIDTIQALGINIMKNHCAIEISRPFSTKIDTVKIAPLQIIGDTFRFEEEAEQEAIKWAIDFDKWQHSWHNEVKPENYEHFLEIIQGKVIEKSEALVKLNCIAIYLQNKIIELNKNGVSTVADSNISDDCEPF